MAKKKPSYRLDYVSRIQSIVKEKGSVKAAAKYLGVAPSTITRWTTHKSIPKQSSYDRINAGYRRLERKKKVIETEVEIPIETLMGFLAEHHMPTHLENFYPKLIERGYTYTYTGDPKRLSIPGQFTLRQSLKEAAHEKGHLVIVGLVNYNKKLSATKQDEYSNKNLRFFELPWIVEKDIGYKRNWPHKDQLAFLQRFFLSELGETIDNRVIPTDFIGFYYKED